MKKSSKLRLFALAMTLAVALAGCGSNVASADEDDQQAGNEAESTQGIDWPQKAVTVVVPASAGGDTDSYARIFGIVLNHRNVENETEKVQAFAEKSHIPIVGEIPRSDEITRCEDKGMTVIEGEPDSPAAQAFLKLAKELLENAQDTAEEEVW